MRQGCFAFAVPGKVRYIGGLPSERLAPMDINEILAEIGLPTVTNQEALTAGAAVIAILEGMCGQPCPGDRAEQIRRLNGVLKRLSRATIWLERRQIPRSDHILNLPRFPAPDDRYFERHYRRLLMAVRPDRVSIGAIVLWSW